MFNSATFRSTFRSLVALAIVALAAVSLAMSWDRSALGVAAQGSPVCVTPPSGMVSWWPGDGNANDIQDGNNGTLQNGATFAAGKVGQAFSFDGVNDFVQVPHNSNLDPGTGSFTLDAWVKTSATANQTLVSKYECGGSCPAGALSLYFLSMSAGKVVAEIRDSDGSSPGSQFLMGTSIIADGNFHHVAMTRDMATSQLRIYVDGALDASAALNAGSDGAIQNNDSEADPLIIGGFFNGGTTTLRNPFTGLIDELEYFNRTLSVSELQAIVNAGSAGKCKPVMPFMVSVDPKAAYLHATCDNPTLPTIVDLAAAGFAPGDGLKLSYSVAPPGFGHYGCGGPFVGAELTSVIGVFSSSNTLLPLSAHPRVPGAIEAGTDFATGPTFFCNASNDIPQDFLIFSPSGFTIQIPAGATHLFLGIYDSYWEDNCGSVKVTLEHVLNQTPVASCQNITVSADANCTADASIDNGSSDPDGDTITLTQTPAGPYPLGTTTVTLTVTDNKGASDTCNAIVTVVDSTSPLIACPANITVTGNILGSCSANVSVGAATATDNCSAPTVSGSRSDGQILTAPYPLGLTTIIWTATDAAGNAAYCHQTVTVTNPAPVVTITGPPTGSVYAVNTPISFTGSFTDNPGGTHMATWTFDTLTTAGTVNETTGEVTGSYTFTAAGVYKVTLTVTDGCGGMGSASTIGELDLLVVIYDPNGGWVTGGGWINSPAGAYVPNLSLTGKANFGFVSKYQNGQSVPTGNTEFHFKAGDLKFKSTSYEWMVISGGKKAQYKGFGTINGSGNYRFMLTAIDGQQPGGGGADKFRIRIWSDAGGLVYDNQMNDPDSNDPTTVLGGGSIQIHH